MGQSFKSKINPQSRVSATKSSVGVFHTMALWDIWRSDGVHFTVL